MQVLWCYITKYGSSYLWDMFFQSYMFKITKINKHLNFLVAKQVAKEFSVYWHVIMQILTPSRGYTRRHCEDIQSIHANSVIVTYCIFHKVTILWHHK